MPVATINASTWFHAKNQRGGTRFSGPAAAPFLLLSLGAEKLLQLAALEHLHHDVGAADELALDVELRHGRPVAKFLDALPDVRVLEHVDRRILGAEPIEDGDGAAGKAA